ncbi:aminotransferase class V-fold PLP-dependent enzyme [Stratiformator vulcanicus]|uniref:Isopenicillin N epimerase n=1 Tax=Stratiformator vulcanicus TaxID=2527980 RepID=A0A517R542_9PLAN|nr:aminotransferase class V-fold PLP-dependent enzyme [Stratiformator vulcanicus]QDT38982.1 Isopenicillin N epimerase [Stratiformator vulcanicus]
MSASSVSSKAIRDQWRLREGVTYLNHGSFGPSPEPVLAERERWTRELESQPMDFFVRRIENELEAAADKLGKFVGCEGRDLILVPNATVAMNIVLRNTVLEAGDEVLLTNHEYGAVRRMWQSHCDETGGRIVVASLPRTLGDDAEIVESLFERVSDRTKLIVVSHVTSPTAVILPVEAICRRARERGIQVCVDGPHAPAMVPLSLRKIDCDFYTASCHKWLSAPFGTGFLYVRRKHQQGFKPLIASWGGRLVGGGQASWKDEFHWWGTHDPSAFLAVPAAIEFLEEYGVDRFRTETHQLARYARQRIQDVTGLPANLYGNDDMFGSMITLPLPEVERDASFWKPDPLQIALREQDKIEVPVVHWGGRRFVRVSCHLYNDRPEIDRLAVALGEHLQDHRLGTAP